MILFFPSEAPWRGEAKEMIAYGVSVTRVPNKIMEDNKLRRKILGIPMFPIVAITLAILLAGGAALAGFMMTREVPSTISVVGVDACEVYADEGLTIPLTDLAFSDIMVGETTDPITFWVRNESDESGYPFYVALSQSGLNSLLTLYEDANGLVPEYSDVLPIPTDSDYQEGYWEAGSPATSILGGIDASVTLVEVADISGFPSSGTLYCEGEAITYTGLRAYEPKGDDTPGYWTEGTSAILAGDIGPTNDFIVISDSSPRFPESGGVVKIDDEMISYGNMRWGGSAQVLEECIRGVEGTLAADHVIDSTVTLMEWVDPIPGSAEILAGFTGCTRGAHDTTAAAHGAVAISQAEWVGETGGDLYELEPQAVLPVTIYLEADPDISRGDYPFTTIIIAQEEMF